jgi:threonine dehydrogenase-like Zn-dependent dehydrogenase
MKVLQVRVHGPNDVRLDEIDRVPPGDTDAVVDIAACGICGSDRDYISMGGLGGSEPMPLGHEMAGVVREVGSGITRLSAGDRVVVRPGDDELGYLGNGASEGGLTPQLLVRRAERRLYPIPDALDLEIAALAEPVAVGMKAVNQAGLTLDDKVVVFGCGPIGLAAIATLADRGNQQIVAVDLSGRRRQLARELGAATVIDPTDEDVWARIGKEHGTVTSTLGSMVATDAFIEASGASSVLPQVIAHAGPGATLSVVAIHHADVAISFLSVTAKQLTIRGSVCYPDRFEDAIDLLSRHDLSPMITHRFPLAEWSEAIDTVISTECGKVLVLP